jgi:hypothetical protein
MQLMFSRLSRKLTHPEEYKSLLYEKDINTICDQFHVFRQLC